MIGVPNWNTVIGGQSCFAEQAKDCFWKSLISICHVDISYICRVWCLYCIIWFCRNAFDRQKHNVSNVSNLDSVQKIVEALNIPKAIEIVNVPIEGVPTESNNTIQTSNATNIANVNVANAYERFSETIFCLFCKARLATNDGISIRYADHLCKYKSCSDKIQHTVYWYPHSIKLYSRLKTIWNITYTF
jgi:hypothetical protein